MKPRYIFALLLAVGYTNFSFSEEIIVKGRMIDAMTLQPIPGGILMVEGSRMGATADPNGVFSIKADTANYIKLSPSGYEPQIFKARHQLGNITMRKVIPEGEEEILIANSPLDIFLDLCHDSRLYNH